MGSLCLEEAICNYTGLKITLKINYLIIIIIAGKTNISEMLRHLPSPLQKE
jgi:hypothetical protein